MTKPTDAAPPPVTRLLVEVTWEGNYYRPHERAELVEDWIAHALEDRAGTSTTRITNLDLRRPADQLGETPEQTLAARRTHTAAVRTLLDAAIDAALPLSGGNVRPALDRIPGHSTTERTIR